MSFSYDVTFRVRQLLLWTYGCHRSWKPFRVTSIRPYGFCYVLGHAYTNQDNLVGTTYAPL